MIAVCVGLGIIRLAREKSQRLSSVLIVTNFTIEVFSGSALKSRLVFSDPEKTSQCNEYPATMNSFEATMCMMDEQCVVSNVGFGG